MASAQLSDKGQDVFSEAVLKDLNNENTDVEILCGGTKFRSNKCFLSSASQKFARIFKNSGKEIQAIHIADVDKDIFMKLLNYVHKAKLEELDMDDAPKLYLAASTYLMQPLKSLVASYMVQNLNELTVPKILIAVWKCEDKNSEEDKRLLMAVKTFISNNKGFVQTSAWKTFKDEFPEAAELIA